VTSTRVQVEGRGAREPVADNASDAGRAQNRRVEIFLRDPQA
jgi:flagellar motor protein MotB